MATPTREEMEAAGLFFAVVDIHRCYISAEDVQVNVAEELGSSDETVEFWTKCRHQLNGLIDAGEAS